MGQKAKSSKAGRNSKRPTNQRYKASNRAEKRKVRNLMRSNGLTEAEATMFRHRQREAARNAAPKD